MRLGRALGAFRRLTKAAISSHSTATSSGSWDGPANESRLAQNDADSYREAFAWVDPDGKETNKSAYAFIHHEVGSDGSIGAANMTACRSGIAILNGGRGVDVSEQPWGNDRKAIFNHLARHLRDGGKEPPELRTRAATAPAPEPLHIVKQDDGTYRWIGFSATAFIDREGEIISTEALEGAVDLMDETGDHGPLLLWHIDELQIGSADFAAVEGRVLIESGLIDPVIGEKLLAYDEPLGMSVGAWVAGGGETSGVFDLAIVFERSVVPLDAAANPYTAFDLEDPMNDRKFAFLSRIVGEDTAAKLSNTAKATSATLEGSGVAYKTADDDPVTAIRAAIVGAPDETREAVESALKSLTGDGIGDGTAADGSADDPNRGVTKDGGDGDGDTGSNPPDSAGGDGTGDGTGAGDGDGNDEAAAAVREALTTLASRVEAVESATSDLDSVRSDISDIKGSIGELATALKDMSGEPKISKAFGNRPSESDANKVDGDNAALKDALPPQGESPVDGYLNDILKVGS